MPNRYALMWYGPGDTIVVAFVEFDDPPNERVVLARVERSECAEAREVCTIRRAMKSDYACHSVRVRDLGVPVRVYALEGEEVVAADSGGWEEVLCKVFGACW